MKRALLLLLCCFPISSASVRALCNRRWVLPSNGTQRTPTTVRDAFQTQINTTSCAFDDLQIFVGWPYTGPVSLNVRTHLAPLTSAPNPVGGPMRANDFLNTLGVATHLSQGLVTEPQVVQGLRYMGIRHFRDDGTTNAAVLSQFCAVHVATGATMSELPWGGNLKDTLSFLDTLAKCRALLDVEGQNEPNNQNFEYKGKMCSTSTSFLPCAQFQAAFYAAAKKDPNLASLPMFAETEPGAEPDNAGLQYLAIPAGAGTLMPDGTVFADYANVHNYVRCNACKSIVDNQAWKAENPGLKEGSWDGLDGEFINKTWSKGFVAAPVSMGATMRRVTTETGWPLDGSITPEQQGRLYVNLLLTAAARGWAYTFIYELKDDSSTDRFGLYNTSFKPRLAATYIHNLTTIAADSSSAFSLAPVACTIPAKPATVHDLLLQKRNGTYELAVWDDRPISEGTDSVTVNLPSIFATVNLYDVTRGTFPVQTLSNTSSIPLTLSDHAMIVEFHK